MTELKKSPGKKGTGTSSLKKDLSEMTPREKKDFLQNDIVERMIRIEQKVLAAEGKKISPKESDFYKNLSIEAKKGFNKHLVKKKGKGVAKLLLLLAPLFVFGLMRFNVTGNVVRNATGAEPYWWGWVALGIFIILGIFMWATHIMRSRMNKRLKSHENDLVKRLVKKK